MKAPEQLIIDKVFSGEASKNEVREVVRWLATKDGQALLQERMNHDESLIFPGHEEEFIGHAIPSEEIYTQIMRKIRMRHIWSYTFKIAAVLIPLVLILGLYINLNSRVDLFSSSEFEEVTVPQGEHLQLMFQDGTKVCLNSMSHIRYPKKFGLDERKVELNGEGYFEVAKLKNRPFIVKLSYVNVKVLGTTFNISSYDEDPDISVTLNTGIVKLSGYTFKPLNMNPGDKAVYNKESGNCMIYHHAKVQQSSLWKQDVLNFDNAPLQVVMSTLSRRFGCKFITANSSVMKYSFTLQTRFTDLRSILNELEKISPLRFTVDGQTVTVNKE